jgi:hypothetical protein
MSTSSISNGGGGFTRQMSGATSTIAGVSGAVPTPNAGDQEKALLGNGTWGEVSGKDRLFLSNTAVAPAIALNPTALEITAAMGSALDTVIYYTGTNSSTDTPTFIFHVDNSGVVTLLNTPSTGQLLTYGRVRASTTLPTISYSITSPGTAINFNAVTYSSGVTFSGTNGIIPSVSGRYKAEWFIMVGSADVNGDGTFRVVQNGVSLGQVFVNMMEAAGVNQISSFIDVDLVAGLPVTLQFNPLVADSIPFDSGSYFQLSQLPTSVVAVVDTVVDFGEVNLTTNFAPTTVFTNVTGMSVTLPSAGTYRLRYNVSAAMTHSSDTVRILYGRLFDSTNSIEVPTSLSTIGGFDNEQNGLTATNFFTSGFEATYTVAAATTINLQGYISAATTGTSEFRAATSTTGGTKLSFEKIAGQLSQTGSTVSTVSVNLTGSNFSIPASNTDVIFNTIAEGSIPYSTTTGVFSLTAGIKYELVATLKSRATTAGYVQYEWVDGVTGLPIAGSTNGLDIHAPAILVEGSSGRAYLLYTPSTNQTVKVRVTGISGTVILLDANRCNANIKQLGSTSNTVGTLPAVDQLSAGYFDVGTMRIQRGTHNDGNVDTTTVTLPAPFANDIYSVVANSKTSAGSLSCENLTATTFDIDRASTTTTTQDYSWIAIGFKP